MIGHLVGVVAGFAAAGLIVAGLAVLFGPVALLVAAAPFAVVAAFLIDPERLH